MDGFMCAAIISYARFLLAWLSWPSDELKFKGKAVPAARRRLAIVSLISIPWASEAVPLHITSLMVPLLTVDSDALLPSCQLNPKSFTLQPLAV
jgi:di/tricarboxylate transporter